MHAYVHRETCIQCGLCPGVCPEVFSILPGESAQAITEPVPQEYLAAAQEAAAIVGGVLGMAIPLAIVALTERKRRADSSWQPRLVRIIPAVTPDTK